MIGLISNFKMKKTHTNDEVRWLLLSKIIIFPEIQLECIEF